MAGDRGTAKGNRTKARYAALLERSRGVALVDSGVRRRCDVPCILDRPDTRAGPELCSRPAPAAAGSANWVAAVGPHGLLVRAVTGAAPPNDRAFELWAISPGATSPRSLGVIPSDGELKLAMLPPDLRDGTTLANSIEPIGGSPTKRPTGPVVFVGAVKGV